MDTSTTTKDSWNFIEQSLTKQKTNKTHRPRSDAELPSLNSDLGTEGPRGKIPQVGIQPWQLSIRSWSTHDIKNENSLTLQSLVTVNHFTSAMGPRGKIPQVGIQPWQLSIRSWSIAEWLTRLTSALNEN
ncbi:hypothetical protein OUZ56_009001 [Daphnia magna]|uniref:Uncharacterized protein n=1 Tax=Daphnia magna TaxID=35525 RepID=A0ABR0AEQ8_9CRUS|nr:hypothetical protein OUZ56_009001 [Daphnia magna]